MRILRHAELRLAGAAIGHHVQTHAPFFEGDPAALHLGNNIRLLTGAMLRAAGPKHSLKIDEDTYFNRNAIIDSRASIRIGRGSIFGPNVYVCDYDHSFKFNADGNRADDGDTAPVSIGEHVWVGANACVLKGITIGDRAVIGAGSVVTKSVPAGAIAVGNPARTVRIVLGVSGAEEAEDPT